jgi:signal transduction histidine kinase
MQPQEGSPIDVLVQLSGLIEKHREALLTLWRGQVRQLPSARHLDVPTLNDHIPQLLSELAEALRTHSDESIPEAYREASPPAHGQQRVQDGFDVEEVVAEYNILRGCIHDLADENGLTLQGRPFHIVNRVLDQAIGLAVQTYATQRAREVQQRREEYLAFVAHDLRTPLNAIALTSRVLESTLRGQTGGPDTSRPLKALHRNVQYLEELVRKILDENVHTESDDAVRLERRSFDLWPFAESLILEMNAVAETAGTRLVNAVPDELEVYADAGQLRRIFQNLVANAIKHTSGGEVVIGARATDDAGGVECSVQDDGAGIPDALIDRVFDKGETDSETGGAGLGLAIVKTLTEAHGGTVSVESREGLGATFRFSLPGPAGRSTPRPPGTSTAAR